MLVVLKGCFVHVLLITNARTIDDMIDIRFFWIKFLFPQCQFENWIKNVHGQIE